MDSYECIWIHGQWPIIWMDGQGVGKNMTGEISDKEVWGRHGEDMDKNIKTVVSHVNAHYRVVKQRKILIIK